MNKKSLTEADIRTKFITPALAGADGNKWNVMTQLYGGPLILKFYSKAACPMSLSRIFPWWLPCNIEK
ncbi:MAG: hypothetical protein ACYDH8_03305 [Syntrophales bacterium]